MTRCHQVAFLSLHAKLRAQYILHGLHVKDNQTQHCYKRLLQLLGIFTSEKNMCRGIEEEETQGRLRRLEEAVPACPVQRPVACELCGSPASLFCQADNAFLCKKCDKWVHGANFLAQRHIRCLLCSTCQGLTQRYIVGASFKLLLPGVVSWGEGRSRCGSNVETKCSKTLELFL